VRLRLMALDFILEHSTHRYLETQQDKLFYFFEQRGMDAEALPARFFRSNGKLTTRYLPDGFPQFVDGGNPPAVSFIYIDDAQLSANAFRSYLRNYRKLFWALGALDLVLVTTFSDRFVIGQKVLARFLASVRESGQTGNRFESAASSFSASLAPGKAGDRNSEYRTDECPSRGYP
jgi:hypothetical protein